MSTLHQLSYNARLKMGLPGEDKVTPEQVLLSIMDAIDYYFNLFQETDQAWFIRKGILEVDQNDDEYLLGGNFSNFSRAERVEHYSEAYPQYRGSEIKMVNLRDIGLGGRLGSVTWAQSQGITTDMGTSRYVASAICFEDTPAKAIIIPKPSQPTSYRIYFQPMAPTKPKLAQEIASLQSQYHAMLAYYAANENLGFCGYEGEQLATIAGAIGMNLMKFEKVFDSFRMKHKRPDTRKRRPYRPNRRNTGYGYGGWGGG